MSHHRARATRGLVLLPWVVAAGALTWPAAPSLADAEPAPITSLFSTPLAPPRPSQGDFGGAGLMQTPIARMPAVGELTASYRDNDQYR
ncbi:MAG: hypothetical protein EA371_04635, partial [Gammaproteobacteria bacterium]